MNRRKFFGAAVVGLSGLTIFPQKSESAQSEEGLSHEQMAQVILKHPNTVCLSGDAESFGRSRVHDFRKDDVTEWDDALYGKRIYPDFTGEDYKRTNSIVGCVIREAIDRPYLFVERLFDISNPSLKVIGLLAFRGIRSRLIVDMPSRHFARLGEKWVELR